MKNLNLPKEKVFTGPALLWKRIAAFLIDMAIIMFVVSFPFRKLLQNSVPQNYSFSQMYEYLSKSSGTSYLASVYFVMSILAFLYFYMCERKMSQTIGKKLMNVYVVSDNSETKRWQFLVRSLLFIPIFPFDLLFIADPLFMLFTKSNQRLSEILSRTRVVENYKFDQ